MSPLEDLGNTHILREKALQRLSESFLELVHSETHPLRGRCSHAPWENRRCHPVLIFCRALGGGVNIWKHQIRMIRIYMVHSSCFFGDSCHGSAARFWHPKFSNDLSHIPTTSLDPTSPPWHHSWHGRTCDGCHGTPLVPATPATPRTAARPAEARSGPVAKVRKQPWIRLRNMFNAKSHEFQYMRIVYIKHVYIYICIYKLWRQSA